MLAAVLIMVTVLGFVLYQGRPQDVTLQTLTQNLSERRSIAVLPIKNLTGDAANDYLTDGITESIINELSRLPNLKVISRNSVFQYKNKDVVPTEIGERLNVETILEGGLRRTGDKIRLEVRLVTTKDGSVLWASGLNEEPLADILTIQDAIVGQIVSQLRVNLPDNPSAQPYPSNPLAYQAYLKGLFHRNELELPKALEFFEEALRIEPNYAPAHEGLALVYSVMESNSKVAPGSTVPKIEFHANKALELDENLVGAYLALATARTMQDYDLTALDGYYRKALLKNPNHRTARLWLANNLTVQGKFEEAEQEIIRVQELDPLSLGVRLNLTELYYYWRKPDKSIEQAELMLAAYPDEKSYNSYLVKAYVQKGDHEKAAAAVEKLTPEHTARILFLASAGRINEARSLVDSFVKSDEAHQNPYWTACLFAAISDKESALTWLEKSYSVRQADLVSMKIDPPLDNLRDDARYLDLLRRVNLAD